jgi:hypothetical protein
LIGTPLARATIAGAMPKYITSYLPDAIACTIAGPDENLVSSSSMPAAFAHPSCSMT